MKVYDVVARTGSYIDQSGQEKGRFENVGAVIQNSNGGLNLLLKKTFNPAGLAEPDKESVLLSLYEPKQPAQQAAQNAGYVQNGQPMTPQQVKQQAAYRQQAPDDNIPF